jgi:hypothetical protein
MPAVVEVSRRAFGRLMPGTQGRGESLTSKRRIRDVVKKVSSGRRPRLIGVCGYGRIAYNFARSDGWFCMEACMRTESRGDPLRGYPGVESRSFGRRKRRAARKSQQLGYSRRLRIEPLEERRMLAAYLVNTEVDSVDPNDGFTSLREAIASANAAPGADTIDFDASLAGKTILLSGSELAITDGLRADAVSNLRCHRTCREFCRLWPHFGPWPHEWR